MSNAAGKIYSIEELKALVAPVAENNGAPKVYLLGSFPEETMMRRVTMISASIKEI